jgi:IclR family transcriptional regulator, acetate operon repressor
MQKSGSGSERPPPAYPITSVNNALRLLLTFRDRPQLALSDASAYLGVAHSTAHRLLAMLAYHDFVRQERGRRVYVAGPALIEIGLAAVRQLDVRSHARPVLEKLAAETEETVHLARLDGAMVLYLDGIESTRAVRVTVRTGNTLPAHCTASGKALLAVLSVDEVRAIYPGRRALPGTTERSITRRTDLERELAAVRERGYATNDEESEEGVASLAMAVRGSGPGALASLSVSLPVQRLAANRKRIVAALRSAVDDLTGRMADLALPAGL